MVPRHIRKMRLRRLTLIAGTASAGAVYVAFNNKELHPYLAHGLSSIPYRAISRSWGDLHSKDLPEPLRAPIYKAWAIVFGSNLEEADMVSLSQYKNLKEFFTRKLKPGVRPMSVDHPVVSPVDGRVSNFGTVDSSDFTLEQIKGMSYKLSDFLGELPEVRTAGNVLKYCTIYLAPGDYHRIHAASDWSIEGCAHFAGNLFPVAPAVVRVVPNLFVQNERVVLSGSWAHGYFSLTAVGATNVGSIELAQGLSGAFPLKTNQAGIDDAACRGPIARHMRSPARIGVDAASELAQFNLGSTVVLVFEAPAEFEFSVREGDRVRLGEGLCSAPRPATVKQ
jgi:phosphatidylserine decarboxylase